MKAADGDKTGSWKMPNSYHVTQLFIGGNKNALKSEIYKNYKSGEKVEVEVRAVIYVPGKILTAVVFPKAPVDNEFPHMTLMIGGNWKPMFSNNVLIETCKNFQRFKHPYQDCAFDKVKQQSVSFTNGVKIPVGKKDEIVNVYFITFDKHSRVTFDGITKKY